MHRAPLLWLLLPLIAGLPLAHSGILPLAPLFYILASLPFIIAALFLPNARLPLIVTAAFLASISHYQLQRHRLPEWKHLPPREARLQIQITRTFPPKPEARSINALGTITDTDPHLRDLLNQKIFLSTSIPTTTGISTSPTGATAPSGYSLVTSRYSLLDDGNAVAIAIPSTRIKATGLLTPLSFATDTADFDSYLINSGINFTLTRATTTAIASPPNPLQRFLNSTLGTFTRSLNTGTSTKHPRLNSIYRAMLLGQKSELSDEQRALFMNSGTMHLFAISGLHIAAIALALHTLLLVIRVPRIPRFFLCIALLALYVLATGAAPSAVRAFIMVAIFQATFTFARPGNSFSALVTAAFLSLLINPFQLFSAGFQMSYGIVATLLLTGIPLADSLKNSTQPFQHLPHSSWRPRHHFFDNTRKLLLDSLAISLSATLISIPSGILFFNLFTPASILANLVLIPLATFVIFAGFSSILSGLLQLHFLSDLFNHAALLILSLMEKILHPFNNLALPADFSPHWTGYLTLALILATSLAAYSLNPKRKLLPTLAPFATLLILLLLSTRLL